MSTRYPEQIAKGVKSNKGKQYHYAETLDAAGDTIIVYYPDDATYGDMGIAIETSGSGRFWGTLSSRELVEEGNAVWYEWNSGVVAESTREPCDPCIAIKGENISGETVFNFFFQQ